MRLRCMWPLSAATSFIDKGTYLDMMYMPDAISAIIALMEADPAKLKHRNAFNVTAMSVDPEGIAASIRRHIPDFSLDYDVDPVRQAIASEWPDSMQLRHAKRDLMQYDLNHMTDDMVSKLMEKRQADQSKIS